MPVMAWAVARVQNGVTEYYADELPGTTDVRWVVDDSEACAYEVEGWAEAVRDELMDRGFQHTFVTTIDMLKEPAT